MDTLIHIGYVSTALTSLSEGKRATLLPFFEKIGEVLESCGYVPYLPHKNSDPKTAAHFMPPQVDHIDRTAVGRSSVVVAYIGEPSTGGGIEIEMAHHMYKPLILIYERNRRDERLISRLSLGAPAKVFEIQFEEGDFEDALSQIPTSLRQLALNYNQSLPPMLHLPAGMKRASAAA